MLYLSAHYFGNLKPLAKFGLRSKLCVEKWPSSQTATQMSLLLRSGHTVESGVQSFFVKSHFSDLFRPGGCVSKYVAQRRLAHCFKSRSYLGIIPKPEKRLESNRIQMDLIQELMMLCSAAGSRGFGFEEGWYPLHFRSSSFWHDTRF
jgi:hypothetical protein